MKTPNKVGTGKRISLASCTIIALVLLLLPLFLLRAGELPGEDYLYLNNPNNVKGHVQELVATTKNDERSDQLPDFLLRNQEKPRFVVFYSPVCPHCVHYAPDYIRIAKKIIDDVESDARFHAISCSVHHALCIKQSIKGYPTVLAIRAGENVTNAISIEKNTKLNEFIKALNNRTTSYNEKTQMEEAKQPKDVLKASTKKNQRIQQESIASISDKTAHFQDAAASFYFTLKQGVFMEPGPLNHEKRIAFRNFLTVLQYALPLEDLTMKQLLEVVEDIMGNLEKVMDNEENLLYVLEKHASSARKDFEWTNACTKGHTAMGYTCGLWNLFHIITLGFSVGINRSTVSDPTDSNKKDFEAPITASDIISAQFVGDALRDFVLHFFGCMECSSHFVHMYDSCQNDLCHRLLPSSDTREVPLWLWEIHNIVNVRLARERLERETGGAIAAIESTNQESLWPSIIECPSCRKLEGWDSAAVYDFLKDTYWPSSSNGAFKARITATLNNLDLTHGNTKAIVIISFSLALVVMAIMNKNKRRKKTGLHKKVDLPITARCCDVV